MLAQPKIRQSDTVRDVRWAEYCASVSGWAEALGVPPFRLDVPRPGRERFRGQLAWIAEPGGAHIVTGITNGPVLQTQARLRPSDTLLLGSLRRGSLRAQGPDGPVELGPGALFASDYECPIELRWSAHEVHFLVLPRDRAVAAHGADLLGARGFAVLPRDGLAPILQALLGATARAAGTLGQAERTVALRAATDLALALLHRDGPAPTAADTSDEIGLLAARRFMVRHMADPALSAAAIAAAAGCSRSALYRLFAGAGLSVGASLREMRLQRARSLLTGASPEADIAAIGDACGYADPSAFGRAFRRRFAMAPRDWRAINGAA